MSIGESMACGTPVVATRVGGIGYVIRQGETGYVVTDNDSHHLASKIDSILARPGPAMQARSSIRASVDGFGWSDIADMVAGQYRKVLAGYRMRTG